MDVRERIAELDARHKDGTMTIDEAQEAIGLLAGEIKRMHAETPIMGGWVAKAIAKNRENRNDR